MPAEIQKATGPSRPLPTVTIEGPHGVIVINETDLPEWMEKGWNIIDPSEVEKKQKAAQLKAKRQEAERLIAEADAAEAEEDVPTPKKAKAPVTPVVEDDEVGEVVITPEEINVMTKAQLDAFVEKHGIEITFTPKQPMISRRLALIKALEQ